MINLTTENESSYPLISNIKINIITILTLSYPGGVQSARSPENDQNGWNCQKKFISLKAYINRTRTQKLKSLAQKMKKWRASKFSPIETKIFEIAKIYEIC